MKKRFSIVTVVVLVLVSVFAGMGIEQLVSGDELYTQMAKYKDVLSFTEKYYVDQPDINKLTESAINGFLDELDPHSAYIPAKAFEKVNEEFQGKFEGIGISFRILNDTITVVDVIGGGPSARIGLLSNDRIVRINDSSAIGFKDDMVLKRLRGPKGTKVKVSIKRAGEEQLLVFEIIRDVIPLYSVDVSLMMNEEVGYISVNKFNEKTHTEMEEALTKLKKLGMKRLILDLRTNPGGYLREAVDMADMFLDGGTTAQPRMIVYTKGRRSDLDEEYFARTGDEYEHIPLVVLISNFSASASEIVAGAIQDWDRGLIVGETSFGKGLVQRQWKLSDGSALRLTVSRYYTPSGRLIQRPYEGKDKDEYRREAYDREQLDGENLDHANEAKNGADSSRQVFHTFGGRKVYGGGGITPDYFVRNDSTTTMTANIRRRDLFYQYVVGYLGGPWLAVRDRYAGDLQKFKKEFTFDGEQLAEFRAFIKAKGITVTDEEFKRDRDFIVASLKAYIARSVWGNEGWFAVLLETDNQFKKALTLFPEAEKLAKIR